MPTLEWNEEEDRQIYIDEEVERDQRYHGNVAHADDALSIFDSSNATVMTRSDKLSIKRGFEGLQDEVENANNGIDAC